MRKKQQNWKDLEVKIGQRWRKNRKACAKSLDEVVSELATSGYAISRSGLANFETGRGQPMHCQVLIMLLCWLYRVEPNTIYGEEK